MEEELRRLGGRLLVRLGSVAEETARLAHEIRASAVHVTADVTGLAAARVARLRRELPGVELRLFPGSAIVEPAAVAPRGGGPFRRFTPYHRRWLAAPRRQPLASPGRVPVPPGLVAAPLPPPPRTSPDLPEGGERAGWRRLEAFLPRLDRYAEHRNRLDLAVTSGLSPYLRFGCLSPLEVETVCGPLPGSGAFLRQLAWRDFFRQLVAADPALTRRSLRPGPLRRAAPGVLEAWREGRTGVPLVDAAMRQSRLEGAIHPRARMVAAAYAVRDLGLRWQVGARWFDQLLVDGDPAVNAGNWQSVAGVGTDPRPGRHFDPVRQARRFDPEGTYVRRYVSELAGVPAPLVHAPWQDADVLHRHGYPARLDAVA